LHLADVNIVSSMFNRIEIVSKIQNYSLVFMKQIVVFM